MFGRNPKIKKLIEGLLARSSSVAGALVKLQGKKAVGYLLKAIDDPRATAGANPPIGEICKLLTPYAPPAAVNPVIRQLPALTKDARWNATALLIAVGSPECHRAVAANLETGDVESDERNELSIYHALRQHIKRRKGTGELFDAILARIEKQRSKWVDFSISILLRLDPAKGVSTFTSSKWLSQESVHTREVLQAFHETRSTMPADVLWPMMEALKEYTAARRSPGRNAYNYALMVLARSAPGLAEPLIREAIKDLSSDQHWGGCKAMAIMHGVEDALSFVSKRRWGIDRKDLFLLLSKQQRIYLVAYRVDEQVCNGGWSQFFTNSNKTQADFAPAALSTIGAERSSNLAKSALAVLADAGGWQSPDTLHERLKQEGIRDKLNALDSEFFDVARRAEPVLSLLDLYAAKNATHFR